MMRGKKKWVLSAAGITGLLLAVYGTFTEGEAVKPDHSSLPYTVAAASEMAEENTETGKEIRLVYDASIHARGKPMKDPFSYGDGIEEKENLKDGGQSSGKDKEKLKDKKDDKKKKQSSEKETIKEETPRLPVLKGIIKVGADRRAMIEYDGSVHLVKEGEQVSKWTVSSIGDKTAVLTGVLSGLYLTMP